MAYAEAGAVMYTVFGTIGALVLQVALLFRGENAVDGFSCGSRRWNIIRCFLQTIVLFCQSVIVGGFWALSDWLSQRQFSYDQP